MIEEGIERAEELLTRDPDDTGHADAWVCLTSPYSLDRDGADGQIVDEAVDRRGGQQGRDFPDSGDVR